MAPCNFVLSRGGGLAACGRSRVTPPRRDLRPRARRRRTGRVTRLTGIGNSSIAAVWSASVVRGLSAEEESMRDIADDKQQSYRRKSRLLTGGAQQWSALSR